jgi:thiol peroxidase
MATIHLKSEPFATVGDLPSVGEAAPDFELVTRDLGTIARADLAGRKVVLNIFPSIDTDVCAASVRRFNEAAGRRPDTTVLCVSMDLPFASKRFCAAEGLENVVTGSDFRTGAFGRTYGVRLADGPLAGLLARSVVVLDGDGRVTYTELVPEITAEPDYDAALAAVDS